MYLFPYRIAITLTLTLRESTPVMSKPKVQQNTPYVAEVR